MLLDYENELRSVADRIAEAERLTRERVGSVKGREEKYTEVFRTELERELRGFASGALKCDVITFTTDKQSGQETRVGADLVIAIDIDLDGHRTQKGVLIQAKVNNNLRHGLTVDSPAKLREQCRTMRIHTKEAFVFAYGDQSTKVIGSVPVLSGAPLSQIPFKTVGAFFQEFFQCWIGDDELNAATHRDLEALVKRMEARKGVIVQARAGGRRRYRQP